MGAAYPSYGHQPPLESRGSFFVLRDPRSPWFGMTSNRPQAVTDQSGQPRGIRASPHGGSTRLPELTCPDRPPRPAGQLPGPTAQPALRVGLDTRADHGPFIATTKANPRFYPGCPTITGPPSSLWVHDPSAAQTRLRELLTAGAPAQQLRLISPSQCRPRWAAGPEQGLHGRF